MANKHAVGNLSEIPRGEGRAFALEGVRVAVFHTRTGRVFCTGAECPHKGGPLADGLVGGDVVVCPLHEKMFDLGTGEAVDHSCKVATYPVSVGEDGVIEVQLRGPAVT